MNKLNHTCRLMLHFFLSVSLKTYCDLNTSSKSYTEPHLSVNYKRNVSELLISLHILHSKEIKVKFHYCRVFFLKFSSKEKK